MFGILTRVDRAENVKKFIDILPFRARVFVIEKIQQVNVRIIPS